MEANEAPTFGRLSGLDPGGAERNETTLSLSGGGYRAALFHLGALTRLNELGLLSRVDTVGAAAGGSILAALLAAQVPWPLQGAFRDWPERVAEPMREIARRNARARALLRGPISGRADGAVLEERYARELAQRLGGEPPARPRFVLGASGMALGGLAEDGGRDGVGWEIAAAAHPPGYDPALVREVIAAVRTDLDAFGDAEQAVLENHGYLLADAAVREHGGAGAGPIEPLPPEPPHPRWMSEGRVREALAASSRRKALGRIRPRRSERARRAPEPASPELTALLERHRPVLQYDSLESFRADSVATIANLVAGRRCNTLHRAGGELIASAAPGGGEAQLDLDFLRGPSYPSGQEARRDDYLDECGGSHAADARAMRRRNGCADVVYGHARHDSGGRLWLQYWLFFYYNDKGLLNIGLHEGDWEMVQLRLGEDGEPKEVTYGQHAGGERASWDEVELDGEAPLVYVARGSHAARLGPGSHPAPVVPDHNDGQGPRLRPRLEAIADDGPGWVLWPGRWGATRRRESFESDSPRGPRAHPQWWDPEALHREARPLGEEAALDLPPPPMPILTARREGERAVVSYRFPDPGEGEGRPDRIVAALHGADEAEPPHTHSFKVEGAEGSFTLQAPPGDEPRGVRASAASEFGVAGETIAAALE